MSYTDKLKSINLLVLPPSPDSSLKLAHSFDSTTLYNLLNSIPFLTNSSTLFVSKTISVSMHRSLAPLNRLFYMLDSSNPRRLK